MTVLTILRSDEALHYYGTRLHKSCVLQCQCYGCCRRLSFLATRSAVPVLDTNSMNRVSFYTRFESFPDLMFIVDICSFPLLFIDVSLCHCKLSSQDFPPYDRGPVLGKTKI